MTLSDWLRSKDMTATDFARRTGLAVSTITRFLKSQRRPDWPTLDKIIAATNGEVTPNDFIPEDEVTVVDGAQEAAPT